MNVFIKKFNQLKNIVDKYDDYQHSVPDLEKEIIKLEKYVDNNQYSTILKAFYSYKDYILKAVAYNKSVFVPFQKENKVDSSIFSDLDK